MKDIISNKANVQIPISNLDELSNIPVQTPTTTSAYSSPRAIEAMHIIKSDEWIPTSEEAEMMNQLLFIVKPIKLPPILKQPPILLDTIPKATQTAANITGDTTLPAQKVETTPKNVVVQKNSGLGSIDILELKQHCPLPVLMKRMGLSKYIKKSCRSPLRNDENPSWGIFERDGQWFWKDHGTGEHGNEITFLARYFKMDLISDFPELLERYAVYASQGEDDEDIAIKLKFTITNRAKPDCSGFGRGNEMQIGRVSQTRQIKPSALVWAQNRGVLKFGTWREYGVYGITDITEKAMALRRLDGKNFPAGGYLAERKGHAIKGSAMNWPIAIIEVKDCKRILLLEGAPDFLAAHQVIMDENAKDSVAPVCMLSASVAIDYEALQFFKGKQVRIVAHADQAGLTAAARWKSQLLAACASTVDIVDMSRVQLADGTRIKDLNDFLPYHSYSIANGEEKWKII